MHRKYNQVRNIKDGDWFWVPKAVLHRNAKRIRPLGIAVYSVLASLADAHQRCFPSQGYIADCLGYSRASINGAIKRLEHCRLINIDRRKGTSFYYSLLRIGCKAHCTGLSNRRNMAVKQADINKNYLTRISSKKEATATTKIFFSRNPSKRPEEKGMHGTGGQKSKMPGGTGLITHPPL